MKLFVGFDHRGVEVGNLIIQNYKDKGYEVYPSSIPHNDTDDYPDFAFDICKKVLDNEDSLGILLCGTGIGMSIAANKVKGIRAARCTTLDDAHYARIHNGANVICLGINDLSRKELCNIIDIFINEPMPLEERHQRRIEKIINYEEGTYNEL